MQSQNGDVQLSVTLDTKGIKSDVQKLKSEIQKEINVKTNAKQSSIIDADSASKDIEKVASEMDKLNRMKKELASGELSMDTQAELDRLQEIIDRKRQAEQTTQQEIQAEQQVVENARSAAEVFQEVAETQARVAQEMEQMQNASQGVSEGQQQVVEDCSLAVREVERMKTALADTNAIAEDLAYDLNMFEQGNKYSDEFLRLKSVAQDLTKEFNKSADELYRMEILGDIESQEYADMAVKAAELADQLREVNGMMADMRESGEAYTEGINNPELKQVERAYDAITNKITLKREAEKRAAQEAKDSARQEAQTAREAEKEQARLAKEAERSAKSMQQIGDKGSRAMLNTAKNTKKLNKELKETNTHGKKLKLNFLKLLGAAIGIRSLYALFSKLKSAVTDSLKTLAQWNNGNNKTNESISMLMNSLNELKNSFGAAFAPILTAVAPALNYLINLITQAINAIAQLIAYLSGSNTWIKAKKQTDDYAKSLNKTGAAAKQAQGRLAAFDDLNVLGKDNDNGGGTGGVDPNKLFEEVPIESWVEELFAKLKAMLDKLLPILKHIWDVFKKGFWDAAKDIKARIADIINNLKKIKNHLIDIFTDSNVIDAMKGWFDSLIYLLGSTVGAITLIGISIAQNLIGSIEKYLSEHKDDIKQYLINMFNVWEDINKQLASFEQAFANIFSAIGDENGQQVTANIIGIFAGLFGDITLLASKLGRDLLELITKPIIDNQDSIRGAFDGLLGSLAIVTNAVQKFTRDMGSAWNELYDAHIGPFIDSITEGISGLVSTFLQVWETTIQPILNDLATDIDSLLNEYIKPFCEDILAIIGAIIDLLRFLWEVVLQPLMNWVIANILPPVTQIITGIMKLFEALLKVIFTIVSAITGILKLLLDFVKDVFEKGWSEAFKNLKDNTIKYMRNMGKKILGIWNTIQEGINGIVNGIIELFENFVNGAIDGINFLIDAINKLIANSSKLPSSIGLHIEPIPNLDHVTIHKVGTHGGGVRIPALAQGAVIPPNKEFLAMLGDQRQGTNIEAPLDTIRDAFQDVVSNMQVQNTGYAQMELDGETFARLIVPYVISELNREGYDLSVIGV